MSLKQHYQDIASRLISTIANSDEGMQVLRDFSNLLSIEQRTCLAMCQELHREQHDKEQQQRARDLEALRTA